MVRKDQADGMICGTVGNASAHLHYIDVVIGHEPDASVYAAMNALVLPSRQLFVVDTHINYDPTAKELAQITLLAAKEMRSFNIVPKVALLSHSNFGSSNQASAIKMRETLAILREVAPDLEVDGEMHGDSALSDKIRMSMLKDTTLRSEANLLVMPNLDAANISYNLLKQSAGEGIAIGPILLGAAKSVHILTPSATVRRIVNLATLAVMDVQTHSKN